MKTLLRRLFKPKPANVVPLADSRLAARLTPLTPAWVVEDPTSLTALLSAAQGMQGRHPDHKPLVSLDSLGQAFYTSSHAVLTHDLDAISEADIATLPPACFDDEGYLSYFSTPAEFPFRLANLMAADKQVDWTAARGALAWRDEDGHSIAEVTAAPDNVVDGPALIQMVPVAHSWQTIAALPNGYFANDWTPFQMLAIARHLEETHKAPLVGMGASWLAFDLSRTPDRAALAADICTLYESPPDAGEHLTKALKTAGFAMLRYTE